MENLENMRILHIVLSRSEPFNCTIHFICSGLQVSQWLTGRIYTVLLSVETLEQ